MGSTLHVKLCPHKVCREKYGCTKCDAIEAATCECGDSQDDHSGGQGVCMADNCPCIAFDAAVSGRNK